MRVSAPRSATYSSTRALARAGGRIALPHDACACRLDLEALDLRHRRLVDARERDAALVGRPPVPGVAIHLLLRDEFGHAITHQTPAFARDRALRAVREVDHVADSGRARSSRSASAARIAHRFRSLRWCEPAHRVRGFAREIVDVEVAIQRNQQLVAVRREAVFHDAGVGRGALALAPRLLFRRQGAVGAGERARIDQQAMARGGNVVGPQVEAVLVVVARLR